MYVYVLCNCVSIYSFIHLFIYLICLFIYVQPSYFSTRSTPICMFFTHMLGQNCTLANFLSIGSPTPTYLYSWKGMLGQHVYSQTCPIFNFPSHLCPRYYTHIFARSKCVFATRLSPHSETYLHGLGAHC